MVTGNIAITSSPAYASEDNWRGKTGISTTDESSTQFATDLREAHFLVRRQCYHHVRERIIFKRSDDVAYLPVKWIADGDMDGSITASDFYVYQLATDGLSFDEVSTDYIDSIDAFNNSITFTDDFSPSRQLYITYYACSKPLDEITTDALKRVVIAQVTILVLERVRLKWGLRGNSGWTVPGGVSVTRDTTNYEELYKDAKQEFMKYVNFLRPFIGRRARVGLGTERSYDPNIAYSSQVLARARVGNTLYD